jgi:hypothetical protein
MPLNRRGSVSERLSVWFSRCRRGVQDLDAAPVERGRRGPAAHEMERRALLGAGLGEKQGPVLEIEGSKTEPSGQLRAAILPVQTARHHQVQDQEQIVLEREDDPLADPVQVPDLPALHLADRRIDAPDEERARDA